MTMTKNAGRGRRDLDAPAEFYQRALPGTPAEVANRLGVSQRRAERSLGMLRRLGLVKRVEGDRFERV